MSNIELNQFKAQLSRKELSKKKFQMKPSPSLYCSAQKIALFGMNGSKIDFVKSKPSRCKSWACPACAPYNARRVRLLLERVVLLNNLNYFFTFTLDDKTIPSEYKNDTHKYITFLFNKLITYLKRQYKFKIPLKYVWVIEYQENGNAHMHGMWNQRVDVNLVRKIWLSIGGGQQMYLSKARNLKATARYVSKYVSKELDSPHSNFYYFQKRYSISLNCIRDKKPAISSVYSWEDLVYNSYFSTKDYLADIIDPSDNEPSFSFNFFDSS